jgi:hypothetical protein
LIPTTDFVSPSQMFRHRHPAADDAAAADDDNDDGEEEKNEEMKKQRFHFAVCDAGRGRIFRKRSADR